MAKRIGFISLPGVAVFPHITVKDTEGKYATNKFSTRVEFEGEALVKTKAKLKKLLNEFKWDIKNPKLPLKQNKEGEETQIYASSKFLPLVIDAKKHILIDPRNPPNADKLKELSIRGGSKIKIGCNVFQYDKGLSLQLEAVQIIERVGGANLADFDEEEGYDAFGEAEASGFDDEGEEGDEQDYDL